MPPAQTFGRARLVPARVARAHFLVSEVADFELRRELLRIGATVSLEGLDELARELTYVPVSTSTWRGAAALWAAARNRGIVTAPPDALDGDVLIAAQAFEVDATIVTTNTKHFEALNAPALEWNAVALEASE